LKKDYIRDGTRRIMGSVTTGYSNTSAVVRDERNGIAGRAPATVYTVRATKPNHGDGMTRRQKRRKYVRNREAD
jgi:hypothetical protein